MITKYILIGLTTLILLSCHEKNLKMESKIESKIDEIEFSYMGGLKIPYNRININISKSYNKDSAVVFVQSKPLFDDPKWAYSKIDTVLKIDYKTFERLAAVTASLDEINMDKAHTNGLDGSTWKIEFGSKGKNKSYRFWSPYSDSKTRELTNFITLSEQIIEISGLKKEEVLKN
ncbi:hypothetical protein [Flavobacterium sp. FlaQc-48]|uniref:hypothetical protein n=1 Tax=Flavobacterium sp. FlaQc-48 TaxID=3374181 RepID=UPI003756B77D